jgi:hypothetical protein
MRLAIFLGLIIVGKCINNEVIISLNESNSLSYLCVIFIIFDVFEFIDKMRDSK